MSKHIAIMFLMAALAIPAFAGSIPSGWSCTGACGTDGADGVVTLSPHGSANYEYITTYNGISGVGALPTGALGGETNGSVLSTPTFAATAGTNLDFYFNYVTSDGGTFVDYGWAALMNASDNSVAALLFTARTAPSGSIVPGFGMPPVEATLTPSSVPIIGGGPAWSPLGGDSGSCWSVGCGYTDWVQSLYTIGTAGNYYLEFGVTNWSDTFYNSGMAIDGVTVGGIPINTVPEPSSLLLIGTGLSALAGMLRRRLASRA